MSKSVLRRFSLFAVLVFLITSCAQPDPTATPQAAAKPKPVSAKPTPKPWVSVKPQQEPSGPGDPNIVKVITSFPHTGTAERNSDSIVNGIKMAFDEVGNKVAGFQIIVEKLDDATVEKGSWDAGREIANANKAVIDPDVMAYIGTFNSGAVKNSIPITNRANLLHISPANTYPGLTKPGTGEANEPQIYRPLGTPNYCRVVPADDVQGAVGAIWAKELGVKSVYVLDDTELYGHGVAVIFARAAKQIGIQVKNAGGNTEGIDARARDYKVLAQKIKSANPDLVYYGGITQNNAARLWKDLKEAIPNLKLMGPDGIAEDAFIKEVGTVGEGTYVTFGGLPGNKMTGAGKTWYDNYKAKFNVEPEAYAAFGYESARVVIYSINKVGKKDRTAIRDTAFAIRNFDGPLGVWSFDENGDTDLTTTSGNIIKNGEFEFVKELKG